MKYVAMAVVCCAIGLTGCATRMQVAQDQKPIAIGTDAGKKLLLGMNGSELAKNSDSWSSLTSAFQEGCDEEAAAVGMPFEFLESARTTGEAGTLVSLYVEDFRYISTGARFGLGVMTGNAFIDAKAKFLDLKSGDVWGERPYSTKSSAWEGIMSAMTAKQAQSICKDVIDVVRGKKIESKN